MAPIFAEIPQPPAPSSLLRRLQPGAGPVLLTGGEHSQARFSLLAAFPLLTFCSRGARCEWQTPGQGPATEQFGNPWQLLGDRLARYEIEDATDLPFPTGGCFGFWGYDLKQFVEPRVGRRALNDLEWPDCRVGFYPSLIAWDHELDKAWIIATGLALDGSRSRQAAERQVAVWQALLQDQTPDPAPATSAPAWQTAAGTCSMTRDGFVAAVQQALEYIRRGHIYQVNLSQRWSQPFRGDPRDLFETLQTISPAPLAGFQAWDDFAILCSSPEQFLRLSGSHAATRPIKGTRPRDVDPDTDARLSYELQSSGKERAELIMITDLLRNDLGRVCEYGSIRVPELLRLERYSHVQHLVSTVTGTLRPGVSHLDALAATFPGGSITGAPKIRAMQIIDELEPVSRGPYTGCMGYLGFNRESQLNILIRTALVAGGRIHYHAGAGIVADSDLEAEYEETRVKARAFFQALALSERTNVATTSSAL